MNVDLAVDDRGRGLPKDCGRRNTLCLENVDLREPKNTGEKGNCPNGKRWNVPTHVQDPVSTATLRLSLSVQSEYMSMGRSVSGGDFHSGKDTRKGRQGCPSSRGKPALLLRATCLARISSYNAVLA